jgi:hypothetical protein
MTWLVYTDTPRTFSAAEMFELEETSAIFFNNKFMSSPTFGNQDIYMTTFSAKGQEVIEADMKTTIEAEISILYAGTKKNDFAISISDLVNNKEAGTLLESLMVNGHFGPSSSSSSVKFENADSVLISTTTDNTVLFMSLIAVVSVLVLTSFVLLVSSTRCCRRKREDEQMHGIKPSDTMETAGNDSPGNSPGKLGARRNVDVDCDESAYAITPVKRGGGSPADISVDSTASRNPLGIMRLTTLNRISARPSEASNTNSMYQIPLHEATDDEESVIQRLS